MKLKGSERARKNLLVAMCFLLPNLIGFLCFTAGPIVLSLFMSFTNWSLKPAVELEFVALRNYADLFADMDFWFYLYNTFYFMLAIPITIFGSLVLANVLVDDMLLKRKALRIKIALILAVVGAISVIGCAVQESGADWALFLGIIYFAAICGVLFGTSTYRTMFYIPSFASGVATIVLWVQIYNPSYGLANSVISPFFDLFGISLEHLPRWLTSTDNLLGFLPLPEHFNNKDAFGIGAREAIMIMGFWAGIGGNNMIMYIASIANIPTSLYEAADIDGAGKLSKFWNITVPSVAPTTFFILIMAIIGGLQGGFETAKIMTLGGPAGITTTLSYYIYTAGFEDLRLGYAASVAWVLFAIIFVLTLINWKYGNRQTEI